MCRACDSNETTKFVRLQKTGRCVLTKNKLVQSREGEIQGESAGERERERERERETRIERERERERESRTERERESE